MFSPELSVMRIRLNAKIYLSEGNVMVRVGIPGTSAGSQREYSCFILPLRMVCAENNKEFLYTLRIAV
jgi:hypothetical protein